MIDEAGCGRFRADVEDDRAEVRRGAEEHAARCPRCAPVLRARRRILEAAIEIRRTMSTRPGLAERGAGR